MYQKTKFTKTGIYHVLVAVSILVLIAISWTQTFNRMVFFANLIPIGIAAIVGWAGYRAIRADRRALLVLIAFNALQLFEFHIDKTTYQFIFGPYLQFGLPEGELLFGVKSGFNFGWNAWKTDNWFFNVGILHVGFLLYLLDQIRFVPRKKTIPWEREYTGDDWSQRSRSD